MFTITSSSFKDGTLLAKKNAGANKSNPNCVGENVSPPLAWTNVPAGTASFALVMTDPEGRGIGVDHWIAYGIPAYVTSFPKASQARKTTNMSAVRVRKRGIIRPLHAAGFAASLHLHGDRD